MKNCFLIILLLFPLGLLAQSPYLVNASDISHDIINSDDVSMFDVDSVLYKGIFSRQAYDRRVGWEKSDMYIFEISCADAPELIIEFQVNLEFGSVETARLEVEYYGRIVGQWPHSLREDLKSITLHRGNQKWGAISDWGNVFIHTDETQAYINTTGIMEEIGLHEICHVRFNKYKEDPRWLAAVATDNTFISWYASTKPEEDLAETCVAWLALRTRLDRISAEMAQKIRDIQNRIAFMDSPEGLELNLEPLPLSEYPFLINEGLDGSWYNRATSGQGFFIEILQKRKAATLAWFTFDMERPSANVPAELGDPGHRWVTAVGPYVEGRADLTVYVTTGGVFDKGIPVSESVPDGTITIEFVNCTEALLHYDIASTGMSGDIPLERVADDKVSLCNEKYYDLRKELQW